MEHILLFIFVTMAVTTLTYVITTYCFEDPVVIVASVIGSVVVCLLVFAASSVYIRNGEDVPKTATIYSSTGAVLLEYKGCMRNVTMGRDFITFTGDDGKVYSISGTGTKVIISDGGTKDANETD